MRRGLAALAAASLITVACSPDPLESYFTDIAATIDQMRTDSIAATPRAGAVTMDGVIGVNSARRAAMDALTETIPPNEVAAEHTALTAALADLVAVTDQFLTDATGLSDTAFEAAVMAAASLQELASRVGQACNALEQRAAELAIEAEVRC